MIFTKNHWSNKEKTIEHFEKVIFSFFKKTKDKHRCFKEKISLVGTFKGQDNEELYAKNLCEVVIVLHNLTNKFQPVDISVNKAVKSFISKEYNT